jgi:putative heme iron utilization protein
VSINGVFLGVHRIERAMPDGVVPVFLEVPDGQLPDIAQQIELSSAEIARAIPKIAHE